MKISKKRGIIFLILFIFPLIILFSQTEEAKRILQQNSNGVISLVAYGEDKIEVSRGAGFSVKNNELIITCYDLISNAYDVQGRNFKGKKVKVEGIIAVDKNLNIALLKIKGKVPALALGNSDDLEMGKRIFALGSKEDKEITVSEGTVLNFIEFMPNQRLIKASFSTQEGFSGGPLLGLEGQVLGLNINLEKELQFTIPINKVKSLIKKGKAINLKNWPHEDYLSSLEGAFLAGSLFAFIDRPGSARIYLEKVVKLNPDNIEAHSHLASVYSKLRDYESAVVSYKKIIQLDEKRDYAHYGLGLVYKKKKRYENAVSSLKRALELNPKNIEGCYQLAITYEELKDFARAAEMYKNYLSLKPESSWAGYLRLGICYFELSQFEKAIVAFKEATKEKPDDLKTNYNLAETYQKAGQYNEAEKTYKHLIQVNPEGAITYYGKIVQMYDGAGIFEKAIEAAKKVIELKPDSELAVYNLGVMYAKLGKYTEAIETFNQAVSIRPDYDLAYYNIGLNYFKLKKFKDAIGAFNKFVEITPDSADAWYNIGVGYMQLKKFEPALKPLKKCIELRPGYGVAHYNLAICYLNLKDNYSAKQVYKTLSAIDPALAQKLKKYIQ